MNINKFSVYEYMNSQAIKEHCRKLGHQFSASECAYIADRSKNHTLEEKHNFFKYIINTMLDEEIKIYGHGNIICRKSLQKLLIEYMKAQNMALHEFYQPDSNHKYKCYVYNPDALPFEPAEYGVYIELSEFWKEINNNSDFSMIMIKKIELNTNKYGTVIVNEKRQPIFICPVHLTDEQEQIMSMFELMWFKCPTPFKKGDIVCYHPDLLCSYAEPFVLQHICYEGQNDKYFKIRGEIGDSMDMTAYGYFQNTDGQLFWECMHDYLSLEYYDEKAEGENKILKTVSDFIKGRLSLDNALNEYKTALDEEIIRRFGKKIY